MWTELFLLSFLVPDAAEVFVKKDIVEMLRVNSQEGFSLILVPLFFILSEG